ACFDLATPAITFELPNAFVSSKKPGIVELAVKTPGSDTGDALSASGNFEVLPCRQRRFVLSVNYELALKANQAAKLRLVLPAVKEAAHAPERALEIETWEDVALDVIERDETTTRTTSLRSAPSGRVPS